jgi:hypothetical protein
LLFFTVLSTIDFHDRSGGETTEIDNVAGDWNLSAEVLTIDLCSAQNLPHHAFSF